MTASADDATAPYDADEDTRGVWLPLWIMRTAPSPQAAVVLAQLAWCAQPGMRGHHRAEFVERAGEEWMVVSDEELAERTGLSVDAVWRARSALRKAELLTSKAGKVGGVKRNLVRLHLPADPASSRDSQPAESRDSLSRESAEPIPSDLNGEQGNTPLSPDGGDPIAPEERFEVFWRQYPTRNGKRVGKRDALRVWLRLSLEEHRAAYRGLLHYAAWCAATDTFPKDAHRWLTKRLWEEFQDPNQGGSPRRNGRSGSDFGLIRDAWEDAKREEQSQCNAVR